MNDALNQVALAEHRAALRRRLRDEFAMAALPCAAPAIDANVAPGEQPHQTLARLAYLVADAMMVSREQRIEDYRTVAREDEAEQKPSEGTARES